MTETYKNSKKEQKLLQQPQKQSLVSLNQKQQKKLALSDALGKFSYFNSILQSTQLTFEAYLKYFHSKFKLQGAEQKTSEDQTQYEDFDNKEQFKQLYKQLATRLHPDKGHPSFLFQQVQKYYEEGQIAQLLLFAQLLQIDIDQYCSDLSIEIIQKQIDTIQKKIKYYKTTVAWLWCTVDEGSKKGLEKCLKLQKV